jgi:hypothetical protein
MRGLFDFIWGSVPAEFESRFGLDESVRKLSVATRRFVFLLATKPIAVGTVTNDRVSLRRITPFYGNNFYFFFGEFREQNGQVVLSGRFTLSPFFKLFMTLWLSFCPSWTIVAAVGVIARGDTSLWWFPLCGVGAFGAGVMFAWLLKWMSRNDVAWLSRVIQDSLFH